MILTLQSKSEDGESSDNGQISEAQQAEIQPKEPGNSRLNNRWGRLRQCLTALYTNMFSIRSRTKIVT